MILTHLIAWGLGGWGFAQVIGPSMTQEDHLRFNCGRELVAMSTKHITYGPLFFEEGVLFSSLTASDGQGMLVLQTDAGVFAVPLKNTVLNRVQFQMRLSHFSTEETRVFLSYFHNHAVNRRYFEFSLILPPKGGVKSDYTYVKVTPAPYLSPHMDHLLVSHLEQISSLILESKMSPKVLPQQISACTKLGDTKSSIARYTRGRLTAITVAHPAVNSNSRMPASLPN